jgi:magnesium transporter
MTDTPRSDKSQTRFSTPVSDLDDHRHQPASLPRVETGSPSRSRRPTFASIQPLPERANPLLLVNEALSSQEVTARDFETAVVDDDGSYLSPEDAHGGRRGSIPHSPSGRRDTFRRPRDAAVERLTRSRASSTSSRSVSPPNSVDAFADARPRRRDRAGTVNSRAPSATELDLALQRTISGETRRRPTISDERPPELHRAETASTHSSAEEDVCFPVQEDPGKTTRFDYEELEEFVAESQTKTPIGQSLHPKPSVESHKAKVFNDLRPKSSQSTTPKTDVDATTLKDGVDPALQEKLAEEGLSHMFNSEKQVISPETYLNRWTFFSSELDDTIHAAELGGLLMPGERFRDLFELRYGADSGVWWLDMVNPTEEEVSAICKAFGVHPLTREDITIQEPREKVELFHQYYFVCFRSFFQADKESEDYLEPVNFYAVVFKEGLLTFTFTDSPHTLNVRKRIGRLRDYINLNSDWICYALIDDIVDSFAPVLRGIEQETDAIEDQVFTARIEDSREILRAIGECRKKVMQLIRLLGGKADVIKGFAKRCNESYSVAPRGDVGLYLSDIQDHVVTMMSNLGHFEKMLSRSHSNYLAQISVDQVIQGNQANITLGKVTVIATILVPLNLICGLFGMNVKVPGQDGSLGWFFGILGTIFLFVAVCLSVAKKLRYI